MADLITEAKDLSQRAKAQNKCLDKAKAVDRALEDLKDAGSAGNWQIATGAVFVVAGFFVALGAGWTGVGAGVGAGMAAGGVSGVAGGLAAKRDAMERAMKALRRAVDDLRECLGS